MIGRSTSQSVKRRTTFYAQQNRDAAHIILTDPARYGGFESALVAWARLFIQRENEAARASYSRLPLFCETEAA
jgi:hypothetical protein